MHLNPWRTALISQSLLAGAGLSPVLALYNNSVDGRYFVVRDITATGQSTGELLVNAIQGTIGTFLIVEPVPMVAGERTPPGQIFAETLALNTDAQWIPALVSNNALWPHDYPLRLIPPGWSLLVILNQGGASLNLGIIYEVLSTEEMMTRGWSPEFQPPIPPNWND